MKSGVEIAQEAAAFAKNVCDEKGLLVSEGQMPSAMQLGIASLHGREDTAACFYMLTQVLDRQRTTRRWIYFAVFLLLCVLNNQP